MTFRLQLIFEIPQQACYNLFTEMVDAKTTYW